MRLWFWTTRGSELVCSCEVVLFCLRG
jgi:hypothetical protein